MDFKDFIELFKPKEKELYVLIKQGKYGIESFIHPEIFKFPKAYRLQIMSMLKGVIDELQKADKGD